MDKMFNKVRDIIEDLLGLQPNVVTIESRLDEDLGADSLDMVELALLLEEAFDFDVEIPDEEAVKFKTVQDICNYLDINTEGQ